jgi:hypothetical protein
MTPEQLQEAMKDEREAMMQATFPRERMEHAASLVVLEKQNRDRLLETEIKLIDEYQAKIEACRKRIGEICNES